MKKTLLILPVIAIICIAVVIIFKNHKTTIAMNDTDIYSRQSNQLIYSPFASEIGSMERLMLIDFKDDPDDIYNCFEIQSFDDEKSGQGIRIIAYRNDQYVDVYQQPSLKEHQDFDQCGNGLADLITVPMEGAKFEVDSNGVDVSFGFEDKEGRAVNVAIKENSQKETNPFDVLAPLGEDASAPSNLPIYMLYDFYFVRKNETQTQVTIDGREHTLDNFGMPLDGSKCYFTRYSADPFLVDWNPSHEGVFNSIQVKSAGQLQQDDTTYEIIDNGGHFEIQSMSTKHENHEIKTVFSPAIPDITSLEERIDIKGNFTITFDASPSNIRGDYTIQRNGNEVIVKAKPSKGWKPNESRLMLKAMYTVVPVFRNWSKSYGWTAHIQLDEGNKAMMRSGWNRIED